MSQGCEPNFYSKQIVSSASPKNSEMLETNNGFGAKNARNYSTKGSDSFFLTGAFLSVTYCGRPSR